MGNLGDSDSMLTYSNESVMKQWLSGWIHEGCMSNTFTL